MLSELEPSSTLPLSVVSVFPLETGMIEELPATVVLSTGVVTLTGTVSLTGVVVLTSVEFPPTVELSVLFPPPTVELVELVLFTGATEPPLQILQEFSRMTAPNLVLIHSAIVSNCWGTSNGLSTWRVSTPRLSWIEVMLAFHS